MSNILHPTTGDLIDRFTILELKIKHAPTTTSKEHFISEWREIEERLRPLYPRFEGLTALHDKLAEMNRLLWNRIADHKKWVDDITSRKDEDERWLLLDLWDFNAGRRQYMEEIDKLTDSWAGPEKV